MSEPITIEIPSIPTSVEGFLALRDELATTPHGGAAALVAALLVYAEDAELGEACMTLAVDRERLTSGVRGHKGWQLPNATLQRLRAQFQGREYLPRSYIAGATPENAYHIGAPPFAITCTMGPYSGDPNSGTCKVFVASSGAASPRPVTLEVNDRGIWKASEWSSLIVGVQPPTAPEGDDL